ncbi:MAG: DUF2269 domain-containing protein [Xanthomonadales bacterium]|nr:DUF2269 domain-containing protein [Xanthomonadales bacterium]
MTAYFLVKWLHVLSATVLFGTGVGSAFYLLLANRQHDARIAAFVARRVVWADWLFTTPAAIVQPASGAWLVWRSGLPWSSGWLLASIALYAVAIACWLPVVVLQQRMRDVAGAAGADDAPLPPAYARLHRAWFVLGFPAFFAFLAIFWLMVRRPG